MRRFFIALPFESAVKEFLQPVYEDLSRYGTLLKVVPTDNYHITLKFLGNIEKSRADTVIEGFNESEFALRGVPVSIKGLGAFPRVKNPSILWMGIEGDIDALSGINERIEEFCSGLGFEKDERRFRPHLTIARVRKGRSPNSKLKEYLEENRNREFGKTVFNRIVLYESVLKENGPVYSEVSSKSLK
jgi:RNA 2',3'-cyclic 3'-phosphodiesterase